MIYNMNDKAAKQHILRGVLLMIASVVMGVVVAVLGTSTSDMPAYITCMVVDVVCVNLLVHLGGFLDSKENKNVLALIILAASVVIATVVCIVVGLSHRNSFTALLLFGSSLLLVALLFVKTWELIRNIWNDLVSDLDDDGEIIKFPGTYVMNDIHVSDSLVSPFGKVLITGSTVLFVVVNRYKGYVLLNPNGSFSIYKEKLFSKKSEEGALSAYSLINDAQRGAQRMMKIVEEGCAKRGVPVPEMGYSYAIFLPRFRRENYVFDEDAFDRVPWLERMSSYKKYVKKAANVDYFGGMACFSANELGTYAARTDKKYRDEAHDGKRDPNLVAEIIAEACNLAPGSNK